MNAIEMLKEDHREAMELIEQLELAGDATDADDVGVEGMPVETFNQLQSALTLHTQLEEKIIYPAMRQFDETRAMIDEAVQEHQQVDQLLDEMTSLAPGDDEFQELLAELRDSIEHHVDEEENELFPKAEELCGQQRLEEMGRQMQEMKQGLGATAGRKR